MRIAMWSGPRNLSTAMMYAFGARSDTAVIDEPFYAAFLQETGLDHPMRDAVIAAGEGDPVRVAAICSGPAPNGKTHFYQKQMAHHMIAGFPLGWMSEVTNVFLIRHPARVMASYLAKRENPVAADLGYDRLLDLFHQCRSFGQAPLVIDSAAILSDPPAALRALCEGLGLDWDASMLNWPAGGHADDGAWAPHWYGAVHRSTGFGPPEGPLPDVGEQHAELIESVLPAYEAMRRHSLFD